MNEVLKAILNRYSCRSFTGAPLSGEQLRTLIDAALASPSAMNRQPWRVIAITNKELIDELDAEGMKILSAAKDKSGYERIMSRGGKMLYNAPCMIVAASDGSAYASMDCGILSQNVSLAAYSMGLGSVICGMVGIPLSGPRKDELKAKMGIDEGFEFGIAILAGEAKAPAKPHMPDEGKVTFIK